MTVTETEVDDIGTEDHLQTPPVVTEKETVTEGDGGTDRKEAMHAQGGIASCFVCDIKYI